MIKIKTKEEIELMREAGRVVAHVFAALEDTLKPGITKKQVDQVVEQVIRDKGATPSFLNYGSPPFPGSACISINEEVVHGLPNSQRKLCEGDLISVDVGAFLNGFHGDACRTFIVGETKEAWRLLVERTEESFWQGFAQMKVGQRTGDISAAVQTYTESFGYGVVRELTGHGVGRELHEDPSLPNYGRSGHGVRLSAGMVLALEPMITLGKRNIYQLDDGWTIVTADGQPAAHYENTVAITEDGPVILTAL